MITVEFLTARFPGLQVAQLSEWLREGLLRAEPGPSFTDMDVARIGLMLELRDEFEVSEAALPIVLSLLDQLYALRRELAGLRG
jgi:chaperone modulatory protein CbpM